VVVYCEQQQLPLEQTISYLLDREVPQGTEHSDNEKDLLQVQLLVKAIKDFGLLQHKNCFIEYGAGKGRLSHGIAEQLAVEDKEKKSCHVLIEREPRRLKFDRFHRENPYFMRLRMDITDFNLATLQGQLPESYFQEYNSILEYVGVCKHMCGAGTDLTVASLLSSRG
jgi:tRNA:m4X modification enzyme